MQSLGGYTFQWNPDDMTMPYSEKTVSEVISFSGTQLFEWTASIVGKEVILSWDYMSNGQYNALRRRYVETGTQYVWDPDIGGTTFNVIIKSLEGSYFKHLSEDIAYRKNVVMTLSLRSKATIQTTTTTTSTTTT